MQTYLDLGKITNRQLNFINTKKQEEVWMLLLAVQFQSKIILKSNFA